MGIKEELIRSLSARLHDCSPDELRVMAQVMAGIEAGRERYGALDIDTDGRDLDDEMQQEMRDALFYMAAHEVAKRQRKIERIASDIDEEHS